MTIHFQKEIEKLKKKILSLSAIVEDSVYKAVKSVIERDKDLADEVIAADQEIDDIEVEVEEDCLKILALHQPVAIDLRFIIAVLKINSDLERIGDLAVNVASRSKALADMPEVPIFFDIERMADITQKMLKKSLDSLVNLDSKMADEVGKDDNMVDKMHRDCYRLIKEKVTNNKTEFDALLHMLAVSRHLERIADHATNIAEDVIYMVNGEIVRHQGPTE